MPLRARLSLLDEAPVGPVIRTFAFLLLAGCGSAPAYMAEESPRRQVSLGECAFLVPNDPGWNSELDPVEGRAVFTKIDQPTVRTSHRTTITVKRLESVEGALSLSPPQQSEKILGDEERELVKKSEGGVRYWIRGLAKGIRTVGRYEVRYLRYQTGRTARAGPGAEAYLGQVSFYLYFPENYRARHIYYSFRIDEYNPEEKGEPTYGADRLEPLIESFRLK